jgi:outer membrane protein OmpA-like peptidoglycan-associated protein/tetratricopeptide (TPR) repeat protein
MGLRAFYFILITLLTLLAYSDQAIAQKGHKDEKKKIKEALEYFGDGDYQKAFPLYLDLHEIEPQNLMYNFALGVCYLALAPNKTDEIAKARAIPHLEFCKDTFELIDTDYYLGLAYQLNYQWDKAIRQYEDYLVALASYEPYYLTPLLQKKEEYKRIQRQIEMCNNGKLLMKDTSDIVFRNLGPKVNSSYPDYAPAISADDEVLIFTSRRPPVNGKAKMDEEYLYYEDIFMTYKKDGEWVDAISISQNINTKEHNASIGFSADAQTLFVYEDGDIYMSELDGEIWTVPIKLGKAINTAAWETHITMTAAQNKIYFVSDRKGGYGGRDIYMASLMKDGTWGRVENLGPTVNTPYDEEAPFIHPDERHLYFSSNGHNSMGGFDVFYTKLKEGEWSKPVNLGYPISTPGDDIYFTVSFNGKTGYLSTIREEGLGGKDVFVAEMPDTGEVALTVLRGLIKGRNNAPISANLIVTDKSTNELIGRYRSNSVSGKYLLTFPPGRTYNVVIEADEYVSHLETITIPEQDRFYDLFQEIQLTFVTRRLPEDGDSVIGQQIVVRNAFFDIDSVVSVSDRALKAVDEKELAYSYFLGELEKSGPEQRKELADKVEAISGVGTQVEEYEPSVQVHITETATEDDLDMHILGYDTVYVTSKVTYTRVEVEKLAMLDAKVEDPYYVSMETLESAEYNPEEYFATQGLKEGLEELFKDDTASKGPVDVLVLTEQDTIAGTIEVTVEENVEVIVEETVVAETVVAEASVEETTAVDEISEEATGQMGMTNETTAELEEPDETAADVNIIDSDNENSTLLLVYFELSSSKLTSTSRKDLDKLIVVLQKKPSVVVAISGHTCNIGEAAYNVMLSKQRAQSVKAYLTNKGIAAKRLKAEGYGAAKPIASNDTNKGRELNRRTELQLSDAAGSPVAAEISFAEPGTDNNLAISEASVCKDVKDRVPIEPGLSFSGSVKRLYYFTRVTSSDTTQGKIAHAWYYKDRKMDEIPLSYTGPHWRTYSAKRIEEAWTGEWRVEVVTEKGQVIKTTTFTIE